MRLLIALVVVAMSVWSTAVRSDVFDVYRRAAGSDIDKIGRDVRELSTLAKAHIDEVGLGAALREFQRKPWIREANGLHIWGITVDGIHWFDAGHPEFVGLQVSEMTDIRGRRWAPMAIGSATGDGPKRFEILFPHPKSGKAARGLHECFVLEDGRRVLCAGAFQDVE